MKNKSNTLKLAATLISRFLGPFEWFPLLELIGLYKLGMLGLNLKTMLLPSLVFIIPAGVMTIAIKMGKISDYDITKRSERKYFFTFMIFMFLAASMVVINVEKPFAMNISLTIAWIFVTVISLRWKISGHTTFGTLIICWLASFYTNFIFALLLLPVIAWARYYLKKHDVWQLAAGVLLGGGVFIMVNAFGL